MAELINLDEKLENADWTKQIWDLPPIGSKEFDEHLKSSGQTIDDIKHLPVYKNLQKKLKKAIQKLKKENSRE